MQDQTISETEPSAASQLQQDPQPSFPGVPAPLAAALARQGFDALTAVQEAVLAADAAGRDLQISSQTGSGKTVGLGFVLAPALLGEPAPVTAALAEAPADSDESQAEAPAPVSPDLPRVLILVPTRELAMQVGKELAWLYADVPGMRVECVTGGTQVWRERQQLAAKPRVVVGTPGRVLDHLTSGALKLGNVAEVVLDEADQMLDMGFREDLSAILDAATAQHRTHLVSATFPPAILSLAKRYQREPLQVEGTAPGEANQDIEHVHHLVSRESRYGALVNVLLSAGGERALVFVNTRADCVRLSDQLSSDGIAALPLSGELQQAERTRTLAAFRAGTARVLVATDVASRGLDIPDCALVVHAEPPLDGEVYVHRSGRTGRAGKKGKSVALVPLSKERRMGRMLGEIGIEAELCEPPCADEVRAALRERARTELAAMVDAHVADEGGDEGRAEERLELARGLLEGRSPEQVVAALLDRAEPAVRARPHEIIPARSRMRPNDRRNDHQRGFLRAIASQHAEPDRRERYDSRNGRTSHGAHGAHGERQDRGGRFDRNDSRGRDARPERAPYASNGSFGGRDDDGFERFTINWGFAGGANPKRLLAHVCRRGGVSGDSVGAIRLQPHQSTFDIRRSEANEFEQRASRRDPRDPQLIVRRLRVGARPA